MVRVVPDGTSLIIIVDENLNDDFVDDLLLELAIYNAELISSHKICVPTNCF